MVPHGGDDGHRDQAVALAALQLVGEGERLHALVVVDGDRDDGVRAEAEEFGRLLDAEVADLGGEDAESGGVVARFTPWLGLLAGQQQGLEVGLAAAAGEHAVGGRAEADALVGPVDVRRSMRVP